MRCHHLKWPMKFHGYSRKTGSIPWLLMPWLLMSPGHQQQWYWQCRINVEGRISTACAISVLKNYIKRNHIFCPKIHSAGHEWTQLSTERSGCDFKNTIFNLLLWSGIFRSSHDNTLRWMPRDFTDNKSTLVQVMAWCHQTITQYLSQCWPRSLTTYGVTGPQWVPGIHWV